jgi:hypothetical protein
MVRRWMIRVACGVVALELFVWLALAIERVTN